MKSTRKMFTAITSIVLVILIAVTSLQPAAVAAEQLIEPDLSSYIIEFSDGEAAAEFESNAGEETQTQALNETLVCAQLTENRAQTLAESEEVLYVEEDIVVRANEEEGETQTETEDETQEIAERVTWSTKALCAQDLPETGEGVRVAVLDSGLDVYSEVVAYHYVDLVDPEYCNGDDLTGHGTAVAGVISAPKDESGLIGIAPDAELYVVRVLDDCNEAPISRIISGIDWCIANDVDIINMSFGAEEYSRLLEEKIIEAAQAGILMIASAGNDAIVDYPAKFTEVVAVGSVTSSMVKSENSATGEEMEFVAPGENVYSTSLIGGYGAFSGTSLAAPHITGAAAVLLGKDKTKSADFIRALLAASCKNLGEASSYGNGIPDLAYALQIYDDFAVNYTDNEYQPPVNTGNPETFEEEDVYVVGEWSTDGHNALAESYFKDEKYNVSFPKFIKAVSFYCDNVCGGVLALHGNDNYVVAAKYLYEVAVNLKTLGTEFDYLGYNTDLSQYFDEASRFEALVDSIEIMFEKINVDTTSCIIKESKIDERFDIEGATDFLSISQKKATIVFGMFFHLVGDVYAHRAIVPPSAVSVTDRTDYGSNAQANQNEGRYFVKRDFTLACNSYIADVSDQINDYYDLQMDDYVSHYNNSRSYEKLYYLFKIIAWFFTGREKAKENARYDKIRIQKDIDKKLLLLADNVPSSATNQKFFCDAEGHSSSHGYPCYSAMIRLCGLGVLQFKDIKYFLKDYYLVPKEKNYKKENKELTEKEKSLLSVCKGKHAYYEDRAPNNSFYYRRFTVSKRILSYYLDCFFASTPDDGIVNFLPYYLISEPYGEAYAKLNVKIDQYYNYLKTFHNESIVLKAETWADKEHSLFSYTTVVYAGCYFIDPDTYHNVTLGDSTVENQKPAYYKTTFPAYKSKTTEGKNITAKDFYYGGEAW